MANYLENDDRGMVLRPVQCPDLAIGGDVNMRNILSAFRWRSGHRGRRAQQIGNRMVRAAERAERKAADRQERGRRKETERERGKRRRQNGKGQGCFL